MKTYICLTKEAAKLNTFTIKDIENLTGIKAHTLRIWEQRYNLLLPRRKETNHRVYDNDALKALLRVAQLYHSGMKISRIAAMTPEDIRNATLEHQQGEHLYTSYVSQLIECSIEFDQPRFERIFHSILLHMGFEKCITKVIYPFLHRIGLLWITGNVIPSQEHFASTIIRSKLIVAADGLNVPVTSDDHYLTFLPEGELHEIPLLYVNYLLKKNGKQVTNLGPDVPLDDVTYFVRYKKPSHVLTYMMTHISKPDMDAYLGFVKELGKQTKMLVMGPAVSHLRHFEGITIIKTAEELEAYAVKR